MTSTLTPSTPSTSSPAPTRDAIETPPPMNHFLMNASWDFYQTTLDEIGDRNIAVTYCDGRMELMSPLPEHEKIKRLLGRLVEMLALHFEVPVVPFGSTTFVSEKARRGLEPDECFYLRENEAQMRDKKRINLEVDPPPDLVIEVDITHRAINREAIYAEIKVPEIWRCDGRTIQCLALTSNGDYQTVANSPSFAAINVGDLMRYVQLASEEGFGAMVKAFAAWLNTLPPRS